MKIIVSSFFSIFDFLVIINIDCGDGLLLDEVLVLQVLLKYVDHVHIFDYNLDYNLYCYYNYCCYFDIDIEYDYK